MFAMAIKAEDVIKSLPVEALTWKTTQAKEWIVMEVVTPAVGDDCWYWEDDFHYHFDEWRRRVTRKEG